MGQDYKREKRGRNTWTRQILSQKNGAGLQEREERKKHWGETHIKPKERGETARERREEKTLRRDTYYAIGMGTFVT